MKYLILYKDKGIYTNFYTNWYDKENNYIEGMIVFDLLLHVYTTNGEDWQPIQDDCM